MDNEMTKRLVWSGLLAAFGALASIAAARVAGIVYPPHLRRGSARLTMADVRADRDRPRR